jgi:hypothetical protein
MKNRKMVAILGILSILLLAGCSSLRIGYYWADWIIVNQIDDMFDLDSAQTTKVKELVGEFHQWHQKEEIPRLITLLEQVEEKAAGELNKEDLRWMEEESNAMKTRIVAQVADDISVFLTTLTDQQIDHLETALKEHNEEEAEEYAMPLDEWEGERKEKMLDRLDDWFGGFNSVQERELLAAYDVNRTVHMRYHEQSLVFQKKFVTLLRQKPSAELIKNTLTQWIMEPESVYSTEYVEFRNQQEAKRVNFFFTVDRMLTETQRQHALKRLESYRYDFEVIYMSSL